MKAFLVGFVAAIVVLPVGAAGIFRLGLVDVNADTSPPAWETATMQDAVHASVARAAAGLSMPFPTDERRLVEGGKLYMNGCAGCHGELGKPFGQDRNNYPPVPQLPHIGTQYTEPQAYWVVKHGIRMTAMSAYGRFYSEDQLWSIAAFVHDIRNLPPGVTEKILSKAADSGSSH